MAIPWIINNLYGLAKRRQLNRRGSEAFENLREQLIQQGRGAPPTTAQQRQMDPNFQLLTGQQGAQVSPVPRGAGVDQREALGRAEAVKPARGGRAGFEYLLGQTDPAALAQLQQQRSQNVQQGLTAQQMQQRHQAHQQLVEDAQAGAFGNVPEEYAQALSTQTPQAAGQAVLQSARIGGPAAETAQVKNYKFRQSLEPDERNVFDSMFRQQQLIDTGGGGVQRISPMGRRETLLTPEQFGMNAGLSANEKADITRRYGEQVALPELRANSKQTIAIADQALAHPGFDSAYGMSTYVPAIRGSDRADFEAFMNQGSGRVFLEAYEKLRGAGQITQIETQKGEQALARIGDQSQSPEAAKAAWRELQRIVRDALQRREESAKTSYGVEGPRMTTLPSPRARPRAEDFDLEYVPGQGLR